MLPVELTEDQWTGNTPSPSADSLQQLVSARKGAGQSRDYIAQRTGYDRIISPYICLPCHSLFLT